MKILARAKDNPDLWHGKFICTGDGWDQDGKIPCGCLLELHATDILYRHHTDLSGLTETYYGFVCCECGCFTEIPNKELPDLVKNKFAKSYKEYKFGLRRQGVEYYKADNIVFNPEDSTIQLVSTVEIKDKEGNPTGEYEKIPLGDRIFVCSVKDDEKN